MKFKLLAGALLALGALPAAAAQYSVLWWDSTPDYGGQAPDALRQKIPDYLTAFDGGSLFQATYVSSLTGGSLATHLASNSYDVIVLDATNSAQIFNAADLQAVKDFYAAGKNNLLYDGNLYIRSINFSPETIFPGTNNSSGNLTVNQVYALASRGGGIFLGTDHAGFQYDVNYISNGLLAGAVFSGITSPSTDGEFTGTELLNAKAGVAPADILAHWASVPSQAIAPTGTFTDFLGNDVTLYSQVNVADYVGGPRLSYISTSFAPSGGPVDIEDPDVPGQPGGVVPEPATWAMMIAGFGLVGGAMRRRRTAIA
ncbi:PEPxxWA-CTERM sorting domain-containing protein [Sandaracinobacter sp. RS1-74]|uniref:PEPxxWA-CTERM sorting domain-containing protein n=1 Tax=Sandaracinobacteroides sayramensis TaxID=2913411 RepID=UPI001EDC8B75|nr:PEPxxWA-CTERM sorting domain-containing protein [Sandaracinobacteroides sayramensis]MCG2842534.1 PEPxxWA-CTERM sorting domain-containing protein [Sandaracinobacteroides sayramensis]